MILELDADSIIYSSGYTTDKIEESLEFGKMLIRNQMKIIKARTRCKYINIYIGTDTNYRKQVATIQKYKSNRSNKDRPKFYHELREYFVSELGAIKCPGEEAEDTVGRACTAHKYFDVFTLGAIDKDLNMIPGRHYNWKKDAFAIIGKKQALRNFYLQLLTGDGTDTIPGLYKLLVLDDEIEMANKFKGSRYKKRFDIYLKECHTELEMWNCISDEYFEWGEINWGKNTAHSKKCHLRTDRILEIARLLWIRRYEDEMWVPPTERDWDYITIDKRGT